MKRSGDAAAGDDEGAVPAVWFLETVHSGRPQTRDGVLTNGCSPVKRTEEELRIVRPDGTVRWIRDPAFPVRG